LIIRLDYDVSAPEIFGPEIFGKHFCAALISTAVTRCATSLSN